MKLTKANITLNLVGEEPCERSAEMFHICIMGYHMA
jgi:hypothetical protein